jgi:RNA polymerase sigma-70 factor (ECF subfamily)
MAEERAAADWLGRALRALPEELRDTAVLVVGEDLTQGEAAEVLGVAEGTVAWRMSEVKKRLRALVAKERQE